MKMKNIFPIAFCFLMAACQPSVKPVSDQENLQRQVQRELLLKRQNDWRFRGRVAISDGSNAGTVRMVWLQRAEQFDIEISLPVSNQKYRLRNAGGKVRLEAYGLETVEGDSAEAVLMQVAGWRIPFRDMQLWLRGMRADSASPMDFNPAGLPAQFRENGWLVEYRAWDSAVTPMPMKVFASSTMDGKNASVRLQIEAWEIP